MSDQAQRLRELVSALAPARSISITSGKGGVGKTNVVVNLAIAIKRLGKEVVIVDADLGLANVDVLLNINPKFNLYHVLEKYKRLEDIIVEGPGGIKIVPGASGITKLANVDSKERQYILEELASLQQMADYILIDTSAGINKNVLNFVLSTDVSIIVTTPEPTAVTDAYAMIKVISQRAPTHDVRLLVNMASNKREADEIYERIAMVSRQFLNMHIGYAGYIVKDDVVVMSVLRRTPFILEYPFSPAGKQVKKIAQDLATSFEDKPMSQSWLDRFLSWLGK